MDYSSSHRGSRACAVSIGRTRSSKPIAWRPVPPLKNGPSLSTKRSGAQKQHLLSEWTFFRLPKLQAPIVQPSALLFVKAWSARLEDFHGKPGRGRSRALSQCHSVGQAAEGPSCKTGNHRLRQADRRSRSGHGESSPCPPSPHIGALIPRRNPSVIG